MLFASTWRFAFAFGMGHMNRDLKEQQAAEAADAEAADGEDPYLGSSTCFLWSVAAAPPVERDANAPLGAAAAASEQSEGLGSVRRGDSGYGSRAGSEEGTSEGDSERGEDSAPASTAAASLPAQRHTLQVFPYFESMADLPSISTTALGTPISPSPAAFPLPKASAALPRGRLPFALLLYVMAFHDSDATPLPLACAAANPSVRLAVESAGSLRIPNGHTVTELCPSFTDTEERDTRVVRSPSLRSFLTYAAVAAWWWCRATTLGRSDTAEQQCGSGGGALWQRGAALLHIEVAVRVARPKASTDALDRLARTPLPPRALPLREDENRPVAQAFADTVASLSTSGSCLISQITAVGPRAFPPELLSGAPPLLSALRALALQRNRLLTDTTAIGQLRQLRELNLSYSAVTDLAGLTAAGCPHLARVSVKGCKGLRSLSPLGELPSLSDVVASQSGVVSVEGLARSRSLVVASFYGCLGLDDLGPLGAIPTLREVYASESNVTAIHGLGRSRSLVHLGLRYCDLGSLEAIADTPSLRVLNVSCTPLLSVQCLARLPALEHIDLSGCAQLRDIGPLGNISTLQEINACGSGVAVVRGLGQARRLRSLLLNNCQELRMLPGLGACPELEVVEANSSGLTDIAGLEGSRTLARLDVGFCQHLEDLTVLLRLPSLVKVRIEGCPGATWLSRRDLLQTNPSVQVDGPLP